MARALMCFPHGRDDAWEAICLDLDLAVQGRSLQEVQLSLATAIRAYADAAWEEEPAVRDGLLGRRAPLRVRLGCFAAFIGAALRPQPRDGEWQAGFTLPCPA